jgi:phosphoenolpyruvate carboxylase
MKLQNSFNKWDSDLASLMGLLSEVLQELEVENYTGLTSLFLGSNSSAQLNVNESNIQILSICFHLLNIVEENTANQTRRSKETSISNPWLKTFTLLEKDNSQIKSSFKDITIRPVFTAHPTEAKRYTVLEHHRSLYLELLKLENLMYSDPERESIKDSIKGILEILLRTGDLYIERPKVEDELRGVIYYLTKPIPSSLENLYLRYRTAWASTWPNLAKDGQMPPILPISFGTWVGGDRDGHPFVTSEVTKETLNTLRNSAKDLIDSKLLELVKFMSLNDRLQTPPLEFLKKLNELRDLASEINIPIKNAGEPWRQYLDIIRIKVNSTDSKYSYRNKQDLINDLEIFRLSLLKIGASRLASLKIEPLILLVNTFGFHLATLDIRQNSNYNDLAIDQMIQGSGNYNFQFSTASKEERLALLNKELSNNRPFVSRDTSVGLNGDEIRKTYRVIKNHLEEYEHEGLGSVITSMTRDETDLISVYLLLKEVGLLNHSNNTFTCPLPIVPLFETIEDLKASQDVMDKFLSHPISLASKDKVNKYQEVMIGYSDSSKDGGVFSSAWNLYRTQDDLLSQSNVTNSPYLFFHGRGGTVSRGAGPTERFLSALPSGALESGLKMTEQGEIISQKYANVLTASYGLETLIRSTLENRNTKNIIDLSKSNVVKHFDFLSELSKNKYQSLISHEGFITYFRQATPIDVIEKSKFGSRPPKRGQADTLEDLRAIPWVFAWNQARFFLSSWYGIGTAINSLKTADKVGYEELKNAISSWNPILYILTNIESSIYSANVNLMVQYSALVEDTAIREFFLKNIIEEYNLCKEIFSELFSSSFHERRPRLTKTLELREKPLNALHQAQISKLKLWRLNPTEDLLTELFLITNAIAGGLRTTG